MAYPNGEPVQISDSPAYFPEWSPDGRYILFRRNNAFWIIDVETKEELLILDKAGIVPFIPNWSHNGRDLIYTTLNNIEKYRISTQSFSQLQSDITYSLATWSLDDSQVIAASRNNEQSTIDMFDMEEEKMSSSYEIGFQYSGGKLDWSLNNKWLSIGFANTNSVIYIINIKTGEKKYIDISGLEDTWYASWSADSKMLVFEGRLPSESKTVWAVEIPEDF
jgi:Tol biopolymer transport system component